MNINETTDDSLIIQMFAKIINNTKIIKCQNCFDLTLACLNCYDCQGVICELCSETHKHKVIYSKITTELLKNKLFDCPLYCGLKQVNVFEISTHLITCKSKSAYERYLISKHISSSLLSQSDLLNDKENNIMDIIPNVKCFGCGKSFEIKEEFVNHLSICNKILSSTPLDHPDIMKYKKEMIEKKDVLLKSNIEKKLKEYFLNCQYNISKLKQWRDDYVNDYKTNEFDDFFDSLLTSLNNISQ